MKLVFSEEAENDFIAIGDYVAIESPMRAYVLVDELEERCRDILNNPLGFSRVPHHEERGIRRAVHGRYLIFFEIRHDAVLILRVLHSAMNYEAILFRDL